MGRSPANGQTISGIPPNPKFWAKQTLVKVGRKQKTRSSTAIGFCLCLLLAILSGRKHRQSKLGGLLRPGKLFSPCGFVKYWFQCPAEHCLTPMVQNTWLANVLLLKRIHLKIGMHINNFGNKIDTQAKGTSRVQWCSRYSWSWGRAYVLSKTYSYQIPPQEDYGWWSQGNREEKGWHLGCESSLFSTHQPPHRCHELPSQSLYSWPSEKGWQADSLLIILSTDKAQLLTYQLYPLWISIFQ